MMLESNGTTIPLPEKNSLETATKLLWSINSPILLLFGQIGDSFSAYIALKLFWKLRSVFYLYITVLSINDIVVLTVGLMRYWIFYVFDVNILDIHNATCKMYFFVVYTTMQFSSWVLVSLVLQRCFYLYQPQRSNKMCTPRNVIIQLAVTFGILAAIDCHYFFTNGIINGECNSLSEAIFHFEEFYFVYIDLFMLCIIPIFITVICNIYFMRKGMYHQILDAEETSNRTARNMRNSIRTTMLLSLLFFTSSVPISIYMIVDSYHPGAHGGKKDLAKAICYLIQFSGYALNVCLYAYRDELFRSTALRKLRKLRRTRTASDTSIQNDMEMADIPDT